MPYLMARQAKEMIGEALLELVERRAGGLPILEVCAAQRLDPQQERLGGRILGGLDLGVELGRVDLLQVALQLGGELAAGLLQVHARELRCLRLRARAPRVLKQESQGAVLGVALVEVRRGREGGPLSIDFTLLVIRQNVIRAEADKPDHGDGDDPTPVLLPEQLQGVGGFDLALWGGLALRRGGRLGHGVTFR